MGPIYGLLSERLPARACNLAWFSWILSFANDGFIPLLQLLDPNALEIDRMPFGLEADVAFAGFEVVHFPGLGAVAPEGELVAHRQDAPVVPFAGRFLQIGHGLGALDSINEVAAFRLSQVDLVGGDILAAADVE